LEKHNQASLARSQEFNRASAHTIGSDRIGTNTRLLIVSERFTIKISQEDRSKVDSQAFEMTASPSSIFSSGWEKEGGKEVGGFVGTDLSM